MGKLIGALIALAVVCGIAAADTGGRMGGGSWGGGGGGGGGSFGSFSSSSSSHSWSSSSSDWSYSSSHYGSSSSGSSGADLIGLIFFVGITIVVAVVKAAVNSSGGGGGYSNYNPYVTTSYTGGGSNFMASGCDVSVLRVVIDGRARKFVQTELARINRAADTATPEGRAAMLREVSLMLRRLKDAWIYGGAVNEALTTKLSAKQLFDGHVDEARAKFREETLSNVDGKTGGATASEYTPHSSEGAGVILVSIVLAATNELYTVVRIGDGEDLRKALENAAHRPPSELIAVEIIWQPSEETDRMSSMQLEAKYPHPALIKITGALAGKTFCTYCAGPFPAELVTCPHCGAPARSDS